MVPGLFPGGAEMILRELVTDSQIGGHSHYVVCLGNAQGELAHHLVRANVPVTSLGMVPGNPLTFGRLLRLRREIQSFHPDLVHTWMYHANLLAGLMTKAVSTVPVLWSLHHDVSARSLLKPPTRFFVWLGGVFSYLAPACIVSVSERAVLSHSKLGYSRAKFVVIPNGIDARRFTPHTQAAARVRLELGLDLGVMLIGFTARYHPMKGHSHFLAAAEILCRSFSSVHFLLCGRDVDSSNPTLISEVQKRGLQDVVHLLGHRDDIQNILPGLDIYSTSSLSESFPVSVGEAMASGLPCVVTDVGDSSLLVGETGLVVPPADPVALAEAWRNLLGRSRDERRVLGEAARRRVIENFGRERMLAEYSRLYFQMAETANLI